MRVIEVAQLGPASLGGYLADLGAEVIKVEGPDGDRLRHPKSVVRAGIELSEAMKFMALHMGSALLSLVAVIKGHVQGPLSPCWYFRWYMPCYGPDIGLFSWSYAGYSIPPGHHLGLPTIRNRLRRRIT